MFCLFVFVELRMTMVSVGWCWELGLVHGNRLWLLFSGIVPSPRSNKADIRLRFQSY